MMIEKMRKCFLKIGSRENKRVDDEVMTNMVKDIWMTGVWVFQIL